MEHKRIKWNGIQLNARKIFILRYDSNFAFEPSSFLISPIYIYMNYPCSVSSWDHGLFTKPSYQGYSLFNIAMKLVQTSFENGSE